jgi:hypothetical protein
MGVKVVPNTTASSTTIVRLRAAITVSDDLAATASYALPAARVAYIDLALGAVLDTTGRFKFIPDTVVLSDSAALAVLKPLPDEVGLTDDDTTTALKNLSHTVTMADSILSSLEFIRSFANSVTPSDFRATMFTAVKADLVAVTDADTANYQKNLADGVAMNDGSEVVDGAVYSFAKGVSNIVFASDSRSLSFTTSRVELVAAADVGIVSIQDYCDVSYFAQDYVGLSQSF